jgi:DNA (cytosine-5)-methyltransferase 1
MTPFTFLEFFAGGGMARAGLGPSWRCLFANDSDAMKVATYEANWGRGHMLDRDIAALALAELPAATADLAWASFPCQDLSLAGEGAGLGGEKDAAPTRSGTFWPFVRLMRALKDAGRAPRLIALENVAGCLTSHGGKDFAAIAAALAEAGYQQGAAVINAALFVPQSRPRVFFIGAAKAMAIPAVCLAEGPQEDWHPPALVRAYGSMTGQGQRDWVWWRLPRPAPRRSIFAELIEGTPGGVAWHTVAQTNYLVGLMAPENRGKVEAALRSGGRGVGAVYRRTRPDGRGSRLQRAEVRFDDVAGCLRTPAGGSSRQTILVVENGKVRSRLLSPREAARLMGLPEDYRLPQRYNDAYHVCGDGVCVPVVRHIAAHLLEPLLEANRKVEAIAAKLNITAS